MQDLYKKVGTVLLISVILYLSYLIFRPFIIPMITAATIAYIFEPVYMWLNKKLKNRSTLTSLLMCILVFNIVVIPFLFAMNSLIRDIPSVYSWTSKSLQSSALWQSGLREKILQDFGINIDINAIMGNLANKFIAFGQNFLTSIPNKIFNSVLVGFFLFFFFREGDQIVKKIIQTLPFEKVQTRIIMRELKNMMDAVIYGQLITAIIQTTIAIAAYSIVGIKAPLFWGLVTLMFSLIPMFGPAFVYLPLSIIQIFTSISAHSTFGILKGIGLLIVGVFVISMVDNVIKPLVISDKSSIHPVLVIIGILGGLAAFGVVGIVIGPSILVFLIALFDIYDRKEQLFSKLD